MVKYGNIYGSGFANREQKRDDKMINFIICDDNEKIALDIKEIIDKFMMKNKTEYKTHLFNDLDDNFMKITKEPLSFKIYILDIETPSRSGIDVARSIRKRDVDSVIIFITSHEELGLTLLKNEIMFLSFINKFDNYEERLITSIKKSLEVLKHKNIIRFEERGVLYTIAMNDILYITRDSVERKCIIKTDYAEIKTYKPLSSIEKLLDSRFMKTHRACLVNKERVAKIDKIRKTILFDNGVVVSLLSEKYRKGVGSK